MNGACNGNFFFAPPPWGPGEGSNGHISFNYKLMCLYFHLGYVKRSYYLILKRCTALSAYIAVGSSGRRRRGTGGGHRRRHRVVVALVS